jgi:hypothetical protein
MPVTYSIERQGDDAGRDLGPRYGRCRQSAPAPSVGSHDRDQIGAEGFPACCPGDQDVGPATHTGLHTLGRDAY